MCGTVPHPSTPAAGAARRSFLVAGVQSATFLVTPVGRDTQLRMPVHVKGPDLHFQGTPFRPYDCSVQGPVEVLLGIGDVVVELSGDMTPQAVHDTEGCIAVFFLINQDTHRPHVEHLVEIDLLALHLAPDAVDMLGTAGNRCLDSGFCHFSIQGVDDAAGYSLPGPHASRPVALPVTGRPPVRGSATPDPRVPT